MEGEMCVANFPWRKPFRELVFEGWEMMIDQGIVCYVILKVDTITVLLAMEFDEW